MTPVEVRKEVDKPIMENEASLTNPKKSQPFSVKPS